MLRDANASIDKAAGRGSNAQDSLKSMRFHRQTPSRPSFWICARTPCQTVGTPHESCTFLGKHTGSRCTLCTANPLQSRKRFLRLALRALSLEELRILV